MSYFKHLQINTEEKKANLKIFLVEWLNSEEINNFLNDKTEISIIKKLVFYFGYYCSLPASSAAVERTFSQAANIRILKRCRLKAEKLENLVLLNSNKDLIN